MIEDQLTTKTAVDSPQKTAQELVRILKQNVDEWNKFREQYPGWKPNLISARLEGAVLKGANLVGANLEGANLVGANLEGAILDDADLSSASIGFACLNNASLLSAILTGASLVDSQLLKANLQGASLCGAKLNNADLRGADLRNASFNSQTCLESAKVDQTRILRIDLEQLSDHGGLTLRQVRQMDIVYDLGILRKSFSGLMSLIHIIALILFIAPYIIFITAQISKNYFLEGVYSQTNLLTKSINEEASQMKSHIVDGIILEKLPTEVSANISKIVEEQIEKYQSEIGKKLELNQKPKKPVWAVLLSYIQINSWLFIFLVIYNSLRTFLLWKTKSLELEEQIKGLTSRFDFSSHPSYKFLYKAMYWMFFFNLLIIIWHTYSFLTLVIYS